MFDTATLGLLTVLIRILGSALFLVVLYKQVRLRLNNYQDDLNGLRTLLIGLTLVPFLVNFIAIANNYARYVNGTQLEWLNNFSFVLGAIGSTATALILYLIYRNNQP